MVKEIELFGADDWEACITLRTKVEELLSKFPEIKLYCYDRVADLEYSQEVGVKQIPEVFFYDEQGGRIHHVAGPMNIDKIASIIDYHSNPSVGYSIMDNHNW